MNNMQKKPEIIVFAGPNGSGKSTFLRMLNRLERHDAGRILIDGIEVSDDRHKLDALRQEVGMVFQQFNLFSHLSVLDNLTLAPRRIRGLSRQEANERAMALLTRVGLEAHAHKFPHALSGGQQQRVAIARALAPEPSVLLCDEPTSALDTETTRSVLATLKDINQKLGVTIVIVTHELSVVHALCRQAAVVEQGVLVERLDLEGTAPLAPVSALGRELARQMASAQGGQGVVVPGEGTHGI